jgi:hypothetical protein
MIQPKEIEIEGKVYIISKFPAVSGREIIAKYPLSGAPKIGDYKVNEETMLKLMNYVAIPRSGDLLPLQLSTRALVDNHVESWEVLAKIEIAMMEYNCSFFQNGRISTFFEGFAQKLPQWITKILTDSLGQLSRTGKQP